MTAPRVLVVDGGVPCRGTVRTPGEKSISHRAVLLGALAEGTSVIHGLSDGADVAASLAAVEAMGAGVERHDDGTVVIHGGRAASTDPAAPLDCGNSGTSMRLLAGLVAGFDWETELVGDDSLSSRPMDRVAEPLGLMGATRDGPGATLPAAAARPGRRAARHRLDLQGGQRPGEVGHPPGRALGRAGRRSCARRSPPAPTPRRCWPRRGPTSRSSPGARAASCASGRRPSQPVERTVPGDPSASAFFVVAGCVVPGERGRRGRRLQRAGPAGLRLGPAAHGRSRSRSLPGEPGTTTIRAPAGPLRATEVRAGEIPSLDEIPALAVAAAVAEGTTVFTDVGELRVKEVDRLVAVADMVEAFGARATVDGDTLADHRASAARCAAPASTAGATTAWPWPPPWPRWRPVRGSAA